MVPTSFDYDTHWENVDRTAIDVIESLAKKDIGFAGLSKEVWKILKSAVKARSESNDAAVRARRDPRDTAIGLPWTRALMAALEFIAYEFRNTDCIRPDAFRLLAETLSLDGDDGLYCRAIVAPYIGFLRHAAPEWVEANRSLLFGSEAPSGLGQKTLDQALKWGKPNKWLLETFRCSVMDAVCRQVRNALYHYLAAMLWDWEGYSLEKAEKFLGSNPELLSATGGRLGFLLDSDSAKQTHIGRAIEFWRIMIGKPGCIEGLSGFGGLACVAVLDDRTWSDLTLKTLRRTGGRIDEPDIVAERAAGLVPDRTTLEIMDNLVRRSSPSIKSNGNRDRAYYRAKWHQQKVEKAAVELLDRSSDLSGSDHYQRLQTALRERGTDM